jgi:uncharacterized protein (DUF697 family)
MPPPKSRKKLQSESFADASEPKDQTGEKAPISDQSLDKALDLVDAMEESDSGIPVSNSSENTDDTREKSGDLGTSSGEPKAPPASGPSAGGDSDSQSRVLLTLQARITVQDSFLLASGSGLLPFPVLDALAVTAIQLRMAKKLAELYDVQFSMSQGKWLIRSLGGYAVNTTSMLGVSSLSKLVPGVGTLLGMTSMSLVSGASTYALGNVLIRHFERDGNLEDFKPKEHEDQFQSEFKAASTP